MKANASGAQFGKKVNDGVVDLGELKSGDRVGFYLERNNGDIVYETVFTEKHGVDYLEFSKNGVGNSKDEWMSIDSVIAVPSASSSTPSGAPLPGALAVIMVGGVGAAAFFRKKKMN